jgi:hypothetical protein
MSSDARDFNNIETRAVIKFFFLQGKAPKEIHVIPTETLRRIFIFKGFTARRLYKLFGVQGLTF